MLTERSGIKLNTVGFLMISTEEGKRKGTALMLSVRINDGALQIEKPLVFRQIFSIPNLGNQRGHLGLQGKKEQK
jgi:hypothetical protein